MIQKTVLNDNMNITILKKCSDELSKDEPKLDYVRGMLETLIEMDESKDKYIVADGEGKLRVTTPQKEIKKVEESQDEASLLDAKARASLEAIKKLNTEG